MPGFPSSRARRAALAAAAVVLLALAPVAGGATQSTRRRTRATGGCACAPGAGLHAKGGALPRPGRRRPDAHRAGHRVAAAGEPPPPSHPVLEDVWLWWQGPPGAALDLATAWRASVARFDLEHTLRFCNLGI